LCHTPSVITYRAGIPTNNTKKNKLEIENDENPLFPTVLVINLDSSVKRYSNIQKHLIDWPLERVSAIKTTQGFVGCALSHLKCISIAKERNLECVLVLEDDCELYDNSSKSIFIELLPILLRHRDKWDIFLGGCTQVSSIQSFFHYENRQFAQVKALTTHFVLYNRLTYDRILNTYDTENPIPIDNFYRDNNYRIWTTFPFLAKQSLGFSLIEKIHLDYTRLFEEASKYLSEQFSIEKSIDLKIRNTEASSVQLTAYIISLPERYSRWKKVREKWSHIFDNIVRVNGIRSPVPHAGCGLAHLSAINLAFLSCPDSPAIILEDDVVPHPSLTRQSFLSIYLDSITFRDYYDAIYLKPLCERQIRTKITGSIFFYDFQPTLSLYCNAFMLYSPSCKRFLQEYEKHLLTSSVAIPIDRLFSSNVFNKFSYNRPISWFCSSKICTLKDWGSDNGAGTERSKTKVFIDTPSLLKKSELYSSKLFGKCLPHKNLDIITTKLAVRDSWFIDLDDEKWEKVGNEHDEANVKIECRLRYGRGDEWIVQDFVPGIYILNNALFGGDPAEGKRKSIERSLM